MSLASALVAVVCAASALQEPSVAPWPDYRGPEWNGHAEGRPPTSWSESKNVTWKTAIPGRGWSSPVVQDGKIWITTAPEDGKQLSVLALDAASGKVLVERVLFEVAEPEPLNPLNSYASPSPVAGEGRVFVHFGSYGTACLDGATGETLWQRVDLPCEHIVGPGSSPFLAGGRLILTMDGGDQQYLAALDPATGETLWRTERSAELTALEPDLRKAYSTPILAEVAGELQLISTGAQATYGYDPATGKELWRVVHKGFSMSSRPVLAGDRVLVTTGFMRPELWCLRLGGEGDVTESHRLWRNTRGAPTMPSSVLVDGRLYQTSDGGVASAVDVESGKTLWQERLGGEQSASPLYAGGRIYFFSRDGLTTMLQPGEEFQKLGECELDAGCMASPAVLGDALILRTKTHLYRIEEQR